MAVFLKTCPEADRELKHREGCKQKETETSSVCGDNTKKSRIDPLLCASFAPTSEVLTRPSWKEQLDGSWVHRLRYLHQWQRKALFTHDRHLSEEKKKNTDMDKW